ncbi:hypothetical protein [Motilimonas eburnea]|uniref:hypothetical protein n=1 Tax=Motilimonas eburnea TaxID=1737488 RepID=UPI001E606B84|nr:hypothetical protein [Motilimonas eburnea]MCE2571771.1 hypothetical protein [Motilimonas eburnea]
MIYSKDDYMKKIKGSNSGIKLLTPALSTRTKNRINNVKLYSPSATDIIDRLATYLSVFLVDSNGKTVAEHILEPALSAWERHQHKDLKTAYDNFAIEIIRHLPLILGFKVEIERVIQPRCRPSLTVWDCLTSNLRDWVEQSDWKTFQVTGEINKKWLENEQISFVLAHLILPPSAFVLVGIPSLSDRHAS